MRGCLVELSKSGGEALKEEFFRSFAGPSRGRNSVVIHEDEVADHHIVHVQVCFEWESASRADEF